jgi:adenylyl-sulfate kinase
MNRPAPHVFWLTGLPAAGKTTLANALVTHLQARQIPSVCLDGDVLRQGLCRDLGLSDADRLENIRRAGEVARLMHAAGLTVVCALVSPFVVARQQVRELFAAEDFSEVFLATPLEECIRRDPKGLYGKAQRGEIQGMTGWDAPYEAPVAADFVFDTLVLSPAQMVASLAERLQYRSS